MVFIDRTTWSKTLSFSLYTATCAKTSFFPIVDLGYEVPQAISYDVKPPHCLFLQSRPAKCQKLELLHSVCCSSFAQLMKSLCIRHPYIGLGHFSISFNVKSLSLISLTSLFILVFYPSLADYRFILPLLTVVYIGFRTKVNLADTISSLQLVITSMPGRGQFFIGEIHSKNHPSEQSLSQVLSRTLKWSDQFDFGAREWWPSFSVPDFYYPSRYPASSPRVIYTKCF